MDDPYDGRKFGTRIDTSLKIDPPDLRVCDNSEMFRDMWGTGDITMGGWKCPCDGVCSFYLLIWLFIYLSTIFVKKSIRSQCTLSLPLRMFSGSREKVFWERRLSTIKNKYIITNLHWLNSEVDSRFS